MNKEELENILGNINFEVETEQEWLEPLGLDRDTWKQILNYITNLQKENKRMNKTNKHWRKMAINNFSEKKQLRSILSELEEWLEEESKKSDLKGCSFEQTYLTGKWNAYNKSLNKIQKLKEKYK